MKFLTDSEDACVLSAQSIGGKAFHLGQLNRIHVPVPRWCVISADALENRIHSRSSAASRESESKPSEALEKRLHLSSDDLAELKFWIEQRQREGHHRFIVRASMIDDEPSLPSSTGQLESFPNLLTMDGIQAAILKCVTGAAQNAPNQSPKSKPRFEPELEIDSYFQSRIAVILQVMIDADAAGVMITANPEDGSRRKFLISANYGACESVVGGQFDCDEFAINLESQKVERRIAKKLSSLRFSSHSNEGLTTYTIPPHLQSRQCIEEKDLAQLIVLGKQLSTWSKQALDIEWVQQGNTIWIVQMKPLLNLGLDRSSGHEFVFDNSTFTEDLDGLTLPLTFSYISESYREISNQLYKLTGSGESPRSVQNTWPGPVLSLMKGRVYNNMGSVSESRQTDPAFGRSKNQSKGLLDVEKSGDFVVGSAPTVQKWFTKIPGEFQHRSRLQISFFLIDYLINDFRSNFAKTYQSFARTELPWMQIGDIFKLQDRINTEVMSNLRAPLASQLHAKAAADRLRRFLSEVEAADILPDFLAGENLESLQPTKMLIQIAEEIRKSPTLTDRLLTDESDFYRELHQSPKIERLIEDFVEKYGDRVSREMKLETETLRENRHFLTRVLKSYVNDVSVNIIQLKTRQLKVRNAAELRVKDLIHTRFNPLLQIVKNWRFKSAVRSYRKSAAQFESIRLDRARMLGITRSIYLELGQRLVIQGFLKNQREIFYLTTNEVHDFFNGKSLFDEPSALIELRRKQYSEWSEQSLPTRLKSNTPLTKTLEHSIPDRAPVLEGAVFSGQGCSPGIVDGEICVIRNPNQDPNKEPNDDIDVRGKILVVSRIDIGWTPLLLQCKGLVIECAAKDSAAIGLARELGVPAIAGVGGISQSLQSGMHLRLDGKSGSLTITKTILLDSTARRVPETFFRGESQIINP